MIDTDHSTFNNNPPTYSSGNSKDWEGKIQCNIRKKNYRKKSLAYKSRENDSVRKSTWRTQYS